MRNDLPPIEMSEIELAPDVTGSAIIVSWRGVPLGFLRTLKRAPRLGKWSTAEDRAKIRAEYKPRIGKWYSTLTHIGYHDTKELAAKALVDKSIQFEGQYGSSPLLQAAIRNDSKEVERLLLQIKTQMSAAMEDQPSAEKT